MQGSLNEQIKVFVSLFKGREDVFAIRWEKDGKSGYMPAYDLDWDEFSKHKETGGSFKDFSNKQYSKLTSQRILNHLSGKEVIGLYPLLEDNSSWFIVADFDESLTSKKSWIEECKIFMETCNRYQLPAYLERSRSGKGGHVWIFFESAYPAYKSRKIILHILKLANILSQFDKNINYDRLFPNQDYHSGKGLGNLIALPLQRKGLENNNSCFIDPVSQIHFENQWSFLQNIKKVSGEHLDKILLSTTGLVPDEKIISEESSPNYNGIQIALNQQIKISQKQLTPELTSFLRDGLNFVNSDYIIKKRLGKNTFGTEPYFRMLEEKDGFVFLPRGFIGSLLRFCNDKKIQYQFIDERKKLTDVKFSFKAGLYEYQQEAIDLTNKKEMGVIVAPPGSGKTIMGLAIAANKKQPVLIIVHRKQLFDQWIDRIQSFLGIAHGFIGKIAAGQQKIGTHITVAMIQSLATVEAGNKLFNAFGLIIVDECHHLPAKTFRDIISQFSVYYLYGLTATPIRKYNDEKLIFIHIGDVIHEVKFSTENGLPSKKISIIIRKTNLLVPFNYKTDKPETLYQILIHDAARNLLIINDVKTEVNTGKKILLLTERRAHINILYQYLKNKHEVITISGEDAPAIRRSKLQQIKDGHFQVIISTGQFLGEGTDLDNLGCLILAYPFSFEGKLIQYIGRVQRTVVTPVIYDYRDVGIDYLEKQFRQRNQYYKKLLNAGNLKRFDELTLLFNEQKVYINSTDYTLSINCLDLPMEVARFREGVIWKVRILMYDEEKAELMTEIIDYQAKPQSNFASQGTLRFLIIDKIKFRSIDTGKFLLAVEIKKTAFIQAVSEPIIPYETPRGIVKPIVPVAEKILSKAMKVHFNSIRFQHAAISFRLFVEEFKQQITFEIKNHFIRPEFEVIKDYFSKVLKKKLITVEIEIHYAEDQIISSLARCEDIEKINSSIIDGVRFEFVKRDLLTVRLNPKNLPVINTLDNLLTKEKKAVIGLYKSQQDIIDDILCIKDSKHYHQLKYLAAQHLWSVLKIRFVLTPFSFLFLLDGESKYHIVWETLNTGDATYIWHFERSLDALRRGLNEIEMILNKIRATGKLGYLRNEHDNFSRVMHDYTDAKSGFTAWKGMLEERLV